MRLGRAVLKMCLGGGGGGGLNDHLRNTIKI